MLAGGGAYPEMIAAAIKAQGLSLACVQVAGESPVLAEVADHYHRYAPDAWEQILATLRTHGVREAIVAGQFSRLQLLASGDAMDALRVPSNDRRDVPVFEHMAGLLATQGIVLVDQTRFVGDILAPPGVLSARSPTPGETADLALGRKVARRMADLDVGQTVVVRRGVILAVEAAEGTDATIRRAGVMAPEAVVVKVSRPNQDARFDIPAVGPETIQAMRQVGARALGIDGRRTLLLDRARVIAEADAAGISLIAADLPPLGTPVRAHS
ncbi:MAG: LpxI family protein [bacterium]